MALKRTRDSIILSSGLCTTCLQAKQKAPPTFTFTCLFVVNCSGPTGAPGYTVEYQLCRAGLTSMSIEIHTPQAVAPRSGSIAPSRSHGHKRFCAKRILWASQRPAANTLAIVMWQGWTLLIRDKRFVQPSLLLCVKVLSKWMGHQWLQAVFLAHLSCYEVCVNLDPQAALNLAIRQWRADSQRLASQTSRTCLKLSRVMRVHDVAQATRCLHGHVCLSCLSQVQLCFSFYSPILFPSRPARALGPPRCGCPSPTAPIWWRCCGASCWPKPPAPLWRKEKLACGLFSAAFCLALAALALGS